MKFQIDVDNKIVKLVEGGKLAEIERTLKNFLGADYENYTLVVDHYIYWYPYITYTYRWDPMWQQPTYICGDKTGDYTEPQLPVTGVYNLCVTDN